MQKIGLEAILDMANFNKGMDQYHAGIDGMNKKTTSLGTILGGAGKAIAGMGVAAAGVAVGAIAGLAKGLWACAKEAADAEEAAAALDAVIKSTGRDMTKTRKMTDKYASSLQATTRFSDEQVMSAETILLQFKEMNEKTFPDAITLTADIAARLGMDMPSAAKLLGKALAEPGEGLNRLRQAGITFTDAEEDAIKAMYETGDAAGAQSAIMDKLKVSVGGAAVAAGSTYAGTIDRLKNSFSDIKERIGGPVLTALQTLADKVVSALGSPEVQAALATVTGWLEKNLPGAISAALEGISTVYGKVRGVLMELGVIKPEPAGPGGAALAAGFDVFKPKFGASTVPKVLEAAPMALTGPVDYGKEAGKRIWEELLAGYDPNSPEGLAAQQKSYDAVQKWLDNAILLPFRDWISNQWQQLKEDWKAAWDAIWSGEAFKDPTSSVPLPSGPMGSSYGGGKPTVVQVSGDTFIQNITDPVSMALAMALVNDRKRDRWNAAMGVAS